MPRSHIAGLDLVRFLAASSVMMCHFAVISWSMPVGLNYGVEGAPAYPELDFFRIGWVGVETFFVLSGFVIAQSANGNNAYSFLRGRIGRLVPAVWICCSITLVTVLFFRPVFFGDMAINQGDINQHIGASKELTDFRKTDHEEGLWAGAVFSGMPAYMISLDWSDGAITAVKYVLALSSGRACYSAARDSTAASAWCATRS